MTKKGTDLLTDRDRFGRKRAYPVVVSHSTISRHKEDFPFYWDTGMWSLTPFADARLVQLARRIPHVGIKSASREELLSQLKHIFIPSQFKVKKPPLNFVKLFLERKLDFVISVLEQSRLGEKGWVNSSELLNILRKKEIEKFINMHHGLFFLDNLVRVEYFLQQNKVTVTQ